MVVWECFRAGMMWALSALGAMFTLFVAAVIVCAIICAVPVPKRKNKTHEEH